MACLPVEMGAPRRDSTISPGPRRPGRWRVPVPWPSTCPMPRGTTDMPEATPPLRIVVLEAEHWHAPLCFAALQALGQSVAGVSSTQPAVRDRLTRQLGCPALHDYR